MFALWFLTKQIPIKYGGPIKKTSRWRPIYFHVLNVHVLKNCYVSQRGAIRNGWKEDTKSKIPLIVTRIQQVQTFKYGLLKHKNLCYISKSMMNHYKQSNWKSDLPLFTYEYQNMFVDSLIKYLVMVIKYKCPI